MRPDLVPIAADWPDWVGVMVTTHFGLVLGLFLAPRGPKRARFGPKCPLWGSWRSSEGTEGPYWVPTPSGCCAWVGLMVTTDFGLVSSLFLAAILIFGPILGPTWSKNGTFRAKSGAFGAPGRQEEARYHESNLGTAAGGSWDQIWLPGALRVPPRPPKGALWAKMSSFGAPGGQKEVQYQAKVSVIQ